MKATPSGSSEIACRLLELFEIADRVLPRDVEGFRVYRSTRAGHGTVYSFRFEDRFFFVSDDPTLGDSPRAVREVLEEVNPSLAGRLHKVPNVQDDGMAYGGEIGRNVYYLWESHTN